MRVVIDTIIASPLAVNKQALAATSSIAGPTMLKLTTPNAPVVIPLVKGYAWMVKGYVWMMERTYYS
ncbi:MAG TPA: hypothetical protein VEL11_00825 [Candidatus Bathyarchaeia archaeon]|nr:hypothetical protein [Candidatus Bathyarchaeia archaeon]